MVEAASTARRYGLRGRIRGARRRPATVRTPTGISRCGGTAERELRRGDRPVGMTGTQTNSVHRSLRYAFEIDTGQLTPVRHSTSSVDGSLRSPTWQGTMSPRSPRSGSGDMRGELDRVRAQIELAVMANGSADRRLSSVRCVWSTRGVGVEQRPCGVSASRVPGSRSWGL